MSYLSQNLNIKTYMSALRRVEAESGVSAMKITFRPRRPLFELHRQLFKKSKSWLYEHEILVLCAPS
jgi:hypothetical protein